jgi:hypothetical protein
MSKIISIVIGAADALAKSLEYQRNKLSAKMFQTEVQSCKCYVE